MESSERFLDASNTPQHGAHTRPTAPWPRCPECQALRITRCPVCETSGTDFPAVDPRYAIPPKQKPSAREALDEAAKPVMLLCRTCDEPFVPVYPRRCPWCGHCFADGYDVEATVDETAEANSCKTAMLLGVFALLLATILLFRLLY